MFHDQKAVLHDFEQRDKYAAAESVDEYVFLHVQELKSRGIQQLLFKRQRLPKRATELTSHARLTLHSFQRLRNKGSNLMGLVVAVTERLVQSEVWQREAR